MKLPNHQQHLPGEILNYMASCWKTCPQVQSAASVHHVLAQMKILIIHSGTQTPSGVGGDLLSEKNCSSSRAHQDSICVGGSKVFTIGSGHSHCNISRFATHWWHANAPFGWDQLVFGRRYTLLTNDQFLYLTAKNLFYFPQPRHRMGQSYN
jgi:hypothetical protein